MDKNKQSKHAIMRDTYFLLLFFAVVSIRSYEIVGQIKPADPLQFNFSNSHCDIYYMFIYHFFIARYYYANVKFNIIMQFRHKYFISFSILQLMD